MYDLALIPLLKATWETIYMVFIASFVSIFFGLLLGICLFTTRKHQALENKMMNQVLGFVVNIVRSIPFIILMISILPLTRLLVGTTIGTNAAIVPLTIAAIPFFARICENALNEVPEGLIEAVTAMGATTSQIISKVLLPESLPALIRGGTLTIIALTGYSAMAGVVGGGGLGQLAIDYGYQRFDAMVMLETVIVLVVLVQAIQVFGDYLARHRNVKIAMVISVLMWIACIAFQAWPSTVQEGNVLRVGVMTGWPEQVMQAAKSVAKEKYGLDIEVITFNDYVQPNTALNNGSIDANIFQHVPYLEGQIKARHYQLVVIGKTFVYPMAFYSIKIQDISQLKDKAIVAIPNDPSNEGRALLILQKSHLIELKPGVGIVATVHDITANPHHLQFKRLDAAQLPRVLKDADLVALTNDFVGPAGLSIKQALLKEGADSPYANIIVVRTQDKDKPLLQQLVNVMHSPEVIDATNKIFPNGAAIPAWK